MFSRKKNSQPPLTRLLELYNEIANNSLTNLSLEQNNRSQEALTGWKSLHQIALYKVDQVEKSIIGQDLTDEEAYIFDEIRILQAQGTDHLERLERKLQSTVPLPQQQQKYSSFSSSRANASASGTNVPTLRSSQPTTMNTKKQTVKPLMKSMRAGVSNVNSSSSTISSSTNNTISSQSAQQAANLIWSPSTSLSATKSYTANPQLDLFEDFDSGFDTKELHKQETLRQLQQAGNSSRSNRRHPSGPPLNKSDENLIDLSDQFQQLETRPKPAVVQHHQQQQQQARIKTSAERAQQALKLSAAVKLKARPNASNNNRSPVRGKSPPFTNASATNNKLQVPKTLQRAASPGPRRVPSAGNNNGSQQQQQQRKVSPKAVTTKKIEDDTAPKELAEISTKDTETLDDGEDDSVSEMENKLIASMRGVDPQAAKQILNEIVVHGDEVHWDDIAGLEQAKNSLKETVVYPFLRPDLFSGLREPARGMLLFGPPGTGKTMLARAVATESKSTFFSISASSLTSKYLGESEKLVRALFQLAKKLAPSIIFVDEIDSLLGSRNNDGENESSRRIKNEFLVQWSDLTKAAAGKDSGEDLQRVLVLAATNLPWAIDEAARRRFVRRQYIPLPEYETRKAQLSRMLSHQKHTCSDEDFEELIELTDGFSGSDMTALAKDAAMGPLRELGDKLLMTNKNEIRPLSLKDFINSLNYIRPSVSKEGLKEFDEWSKLYGSSGV